MEELILKMHEEAMELQKAVTEFKCMFENLADAIGKVEIEEAQYSWNSEKDVVMAKISCSEIKRIIGMGPDICRTAEEILKFKEEDHKDEE